MSLRGYENRGRRFRPANRVITRPGSRSASRGFSRAAADSFSRLPWKNLDLSGVWQRLRSFVDSIRYAELRDQRITVEDRLGRIRLVIGGLALLGAVTLFRLFNLQSNEHGKWNQLAAKQHHQTLKVAPARASIVDLSGRALALSVPVVSVAVHPKLIRDPEKFIKEVTPILGVDEKFVRSAVTSGKFDWLARDLPLEREAELGALRLNGLSLHREFKRSYPQGTLAGNLLGLVGADGSGQSGVEKAFDRRLTSSSSEKIVRRDARGRLVAPSIDEFSEEELEGTYIPTSLHQPAERRAPKLDEDADIDVEQALQLSIDANIQGILEEQFLQAYDRTGAKRVHGLIMDADSGEILGMAQYPRLDPTKRGKIDSEALRIFTIQDGYEPGSTLKPVVAAIALDAKVVQPDEMMDCGTGEFRVGKFTIKDVHPVGRVQFPQVLIRSSNVCMVKVGLRLGKERLHDGLERAGFGKRVLGKFDGEGSGIFRGLSNFAEIDVATHSFGHGISVTPLQLVRAFSAVMNGGYLVKPTLLKRKDGEAPESKQIFKEETSRALRGMLTGVTENEGGTGHLAAIPGVRVAGKTGTAHKLRRGAKGYDPDAVIGSFVGFVDGREIGVDRRLTMIVIVDDPSVRPRWGGVVAAPVFRDAMEQILSHLMTSGSRHYRAA